MSAGPHIFGRVTYPAIARAARVTVRQAQEHSRQGVYDPRDLASVSIYVAAQRGRETHRAIPLVALRATGRDPMEPVEQPESVPGSSSEAPGEASEEAR